MNKIYQILPFKITKTNKKLATLSGVFSTEDEDRHGDIVRQNWDLKLFKKNPVILNSHNYGDATEVVGKAKQISSKTGKLEGRIEFAVNENPKAKIIYDLYLGGFLNAFSVGFIPKEWSDKGEILKSELLEVSTVSVPANAMALAKQKGINIEKLYETNKTESKDIDDDLQNKEVNGDAPEADSDSSEGSEDKGREAIEEHGDSENSKEDDEEKQKGVITFEETYKAPESEKWDAGAEVKEASGDAKKLRKMHTWVDSSADNFDASERKWYKLPHHKGSGSQSVVWRGVTAAMGALLGARGGVDIPTKDKKGVYNHLAGHYKQFDKEPPEFKEKEEKEKFKCECIECGYKMVSDKHCQDFKCPECGGEMRRQERPGQGKNVVEKHIRKTKKQLLLNKIAKSVDRYSEIIKAETRESESQSVRANNLRLINKAVRALLKAKKNNH